MACNEVVQNTLADDRIVTFLRSVQITTANSCVPVKLDGNVRPLEENDFKTFVSVAESNLKEINVNLNKLFDLLHNGSVPVVFHNFGNDFLVPLILLCGEHRKQDLWTCENNVNIVDKILQLLCKICCCSDLCDILLGTTSFGGNKCEALLKKCLLSLRPKLLKDTWKTFPAAVACYQWILFQVKAPHLGDYLSFVLPTALIVVDDFQTENQLCGILCLQHIVENVTRAELGWYGQGDVVFQALQRVLYEREPVLVRPLVSCLVLVLDKLEGGHLGMVKDNSWSRFDDVLEIILRNMEMESRTPLRRAYVESLPCLLEASGIIAVRWSKRLLRVIKEYMEVAGQAERKTAIGSLQALKAYMVMAHPRLHHHATLIFSMLLRLLYDATVSMCTKNSEEELLVESLEDCIATLAQSVPDEAIKIAADLRTEARFNDKFASVVDSVFMPFCK